MIFSSQSNKKNNHSTYEHWIKSAIIDEERYEASSNDSFCKKENEQYLQMAEKYELPEQMRQDIQFTLTKDQLIEFYKILQTNYGIEVPEPILNKFTFTCYNKFHKSFYNFVILNLQDTNTNKAIEKMKTNSKLYEKLHKHYEELEQNHINLSCDKNSIRYKKAFNKIEQEEDLSYEKNSTNKISEIETIINENKQVIKAKSIFIKNIDDIKQKFIFSEDIKETDNDTEIYKKLLQKKSVLDHLDLEYKQLNEQHKSLLYIYNKLNTSETVTSLSSTEDISSKCNTSSKENTSKKVSIKLTTNKEVKDIKKSLMWLEYRHDHPKILKPFFQNLKEKHNEETNVKETLGVFYMIKNINQMLENEIIKLENNIQTEEYFQGMIKDLKIKFDYNFEIAEALIERMEAFLKSKSLRLKDKKEDIIEITHKIAQKIYFSQNDIKLTITKQQFDSLLLIFKENGLELPEDLIQNTLEKLCLDSKETSYADISGEKFMLRNVEDLNQENFEIIKAQKNFIHRFAETDQKKVIKQITSIEKNLLSINHNAIILEEVSNLIEENDEICFSKKHNYKNEKYIDIIINEIRKEWFDSKIVHDICKQKDNLNSMSQLYILNTFLQENAHLLQLQNNTILSILEIQEDIDNIQSTESIKNINFYLDRKNSVLDSGLINCEQKQYTQGFQKFTQLITKLEMK